MCSICIHLFFSFLITKGLLSFFSTINKFPFATVRLLITEQRTTLLVSICMQGIQ